MARHLNGANSFERVRSAVEAEGLIWQESERGKRASFQSPGHSATDRGTSVTYNGERVLIYSFNEDEEHVLDALGLTWEDLRDESISSYRYSDGFVVQRRPNKVFRQVCKHNMTPSKCGECKGVKLRALYGIEKIAPEGPVYIVEGESDVHSAVNLWGVSAVTQAQGASTKPTQADWEPLIGRDLIIVADKDTAGRKRAADVHAHLVELGHPDSKLAIVEPATSGEKTDLSDHITAGFGRDELVPIDTSKPTRRIKLVPASEVQTERLEWLMPNWIPKRSLTLIAGREGLGKSTIACDIAAQATRGELSGEPMRVAYLATEDSPSITVKPRLQAAGADLDRTFFFEVATETGSTGALTLPGDTGLLTRALVDNDVQLVILDAAKSAMHGSLDGYRDDDVRQFLEPLAAMADTHNIAVIGLVHFGKRESADSGKLILGSIAWSQIARSVLSVAANEEGTLIVTNTKANLAPKTISREVRIVSATVPVDRGGTAEVGRAEWGEETTVSAADLLAPRDDSEDERGEIEAVVLDYLIANGGKAPAKDVLKATRAAGLSDNAVKKSRKRIGVKTEKGGMNAGWLWSIDTSKMSEGVRAYFPESSAPSESSGESSETKQPLSSLPAATTPEEQPTVTASSAGQLNAVGDLETFVLGALHDSAGITLDAVKASVPSKYLDKYNAREQIEKALDELVAAGAARRDGHGNYYRTGSAA